MSKGCNAVEVVDLTKTFGKSTVVNKLNLTIGRGEFMGLLGPNGSGKSTTLKCMTGMLVPTSGKISLNGVDALKHHRESLADVGCIIETPEFYPEFTPAETLDYIGKYHGLSNAEIGIRARDVLEEVRLWEWRNKPIGKFSKGMRQRVAIAQALLSNPSLLILDEPTSGLDPRGMVEVREILNNLKKRDISLLISTHILKEVSELCDHVTMINNGSTMISGKVSDLIRDNLRARGREYGIHLRTYHPMTDEFLADIRGTPGVLRCTKTSECDVDLSFYGSELQQSVLVDLVYKHRLGLLSLTENGADLESLYMELTRNTEVNVR